MVRAGGASGSARSRPVRVAHSWPRSHPSDGHPDERTSTAAAVTDVHARLEPEPGYGGDHGGTADTVDSPVVATAHRPVGPAVGNSRTGPAFVPGPSG
ncbi:hypothetical protein TR51_22830 [Kitasatospora griseola]|uniref:Uncharacterized protein n=1 Tax=Kitasatospora griseola TaxID=2064 RepID=A0A0D0PHS5_KITGR|nr:hypothetical protein TR51_22830 [Kitasatospora griseola]